MQTYTQLNYYFNNYKNSLLNVIFQWPFSSVFSFFFHLHELRSRPWEQHHRTALQSPGRFALSRPIVLVFRFILFPCIHLPSALSLFTNQTPALSPNFLTEWRKRNKGMAKGSQKRENKQIREDFWWCTLDGSIWRVFVFNSCIDRFLWKKKRPPISLFLSVYRHTACLWVCAYVYVGGKECNYGYPKLFACFHTCHFTKVCLMHLETHTYTCTLDVRINI